MRPSTPGQNGRDGGSDARSLPDRPTRPLAPRVAPGGRDGAAPGRDPTQGSGERERRAKLVSDLDGNPGRDPTQGPINAFTRRNVANTGLGTVGGTTGGAAGGAIIADRVGGVDMTPIPPTTTFGGGGSTTIINDNSTTIINNNTNTVNYVTNVNRWNSCWNPNPWCPPVWGPGSCWNSWPCNDGFSFGIGFGSGNFSFSLFFGGSSFHRPLCTSWCNPWWNGHCGFIAVHRPPSWGWARSCWAPCGNWFSSYIVINSVPSTWCTPVFAYTPVAALPSTTFVTNNFYSEPATVFVDPPVVTTVPLATAAPSPVPAPMTLAESQAWDLLATGFPRSAADIFARSHDANPGDPRPLVGYALSLAMLEDFAGAATVLRQALAIEPGVLLSVPLVPSLAERVRLVEQSAEIASRQASTAADSFLLLGALRGMQGRFTEGHLAVLSAQAAGEQSLGAARLRSWLEDRMTPRI